MELLFLAFGSNLPFVNADVATQNALGRIFERRFYAGYEERRCGESIEGLVTAAQNAGLSLNKARVLSITHQGFSVFGLVNAEWVRESGRLLPGTENAGRRYEMGERNWHFHVILLYDGLIFDFDFGNEPQVFTVRDYFEQMFLNESREPGYGKHYVGRDEKRKNYQIEIRPALSSNRVERNLSLGEFLRNP